MEKERTIFGTDELLIMSTGLVDRESYQSLYHLYQPVIGVKALALYQTLWSELKPGKMKSNYMSHSALCEMLEFSINELMDSLFRLEAIGLVRTYKTKDARLTQYVYQLRVPLAPHTFLNDGLLSSFLFYKVGEVRFKQLQGRFTIDPLPAGIVEVTKDFNEVFDVKGVNHRAFTQKNYEKPDRAKIEINYSFDMEIVKKLTNFPVGFFTKKLDETITKLAYVSQLDEETMAEMLKEYFVHEAYLPLSEQEKRDGCRQMVLQLKKKQTRHRKEKTVEHAKIEEVDLHKPEVMESAHPHQYVTSLRKTSRLSNTDEQIIINLVDTIGLAPHLINALFYHLVIVEKKEINNGLVTTVATNWKSSGYSTVVEALEKSKTRLDNQAKVDRKTVGSRRKPQQGDMPKWLEDEAKQQRSYDQARKKELESSVPDDAELVKLLNELKEKG
ncbi:DnaD domain protein [Exiguobacterium profundum]|uniref:DnaD domain protein n=1 Tax=Exiguobacterium profundum TaxID=307643 RepID=UPI0029C217F7|nr:DnaD domain protein [Exiguobacterium profundum]MDX5981617.1 DnaD domain protein [Exiguobacterium profundum]